MSEMASKALSNADDAYVKVDRMRYEKNKASSNLAILAILFNALFFVEIYRSDVGTWYYTILIGVSIVYNLLFMMIVFLISEGSKNYKVQYSWIAILMGVLQLARLAVYPRMAYAATTQATGEVVNVMSKAQFIRVVIFLILSGLCLFLSGGVGIVKHTALKKHLEAMQETK